MGSAAPQRAASRSPICPAVKPASARTATAAHTAAASLPGRPTRSACRLLGDARVGCRHHRGLAIGERGQHPRHLVGGIGAIVGGLGEQALDQPRQLGRQTRAQLVQARRRLLQDAEIELGEAAGLECWPAGQHLVKRGAQRPQVGARVHRVAVDLLGRHVAGRADRLPVRGQRLGVRPLALGGAEIGELGRPGPTVDQHVAGLDVAVDDAGRVGGAQRQGDVARDARGLGDLEAAAVGQQALERPAVDPLHDDEGHPVGDVEVAHADDVGVVERRRRARILEEPVGILPIAAHLRPEHLQRHRRLELRDAGRRTRRPSHPRRASARAGSGRPDPQSAWRSCSSTRGAALTASRTQVRLVAQWLRNRSGPRVRYSTVTLLARLRGWSTSVPFRTAV